MFNVFCEACSGHACLATRTHFLFVFKIALAQQVHVVPAVSLFIPPRPSARATNLVVREVRAAHINPAQSS